MKLFGMGSPPQLAHPPSVRLSEQTLCYTNIQIEWNSVHLNPEDKHDVYPVHMYRLQRQEQSSATSSGQSLKWITVYEGPETNCFDKVYTPPTRTMEENSSGVNTNQIISVTYRLSSWNVIGRSEYSYLKYDITRPTVNSWTDIYGKDECIDQPYPPSHSAAEFQLLVLQNAELANASPALLSRPNSSPVPTIKLGTDSDSTISPPAPWSISTFFSFLFYALWLICTIFSTGHTWLWTIFSILSLPITIIYLYMRFNPPGVDSSGHWLKPLVTSMCSILIGGCEYLSLKFPSTKEKLQPIVQFLQSVTNRDTQVPLRGNPETSSTLRQQRFLKRMNSGRSVGEDSADSQNSGQEDSATCSDSDKCYLCSKSFKLQVTLSKVRWRVKHHCHVCMNLFCSKCGEVTHKNFQCPVRGTCRCQRCADPSKHRSNNHQTQQQQNPPPSPPSPCTDHDDVSTISAITDIQEENNFNEKKKNKSFVSLKEFGISLGRKFDKEKPKLTRVGSGAPSAAGIPPRPTLNSTNSSKKSMWIPTPSLGRITSSPPAISVDRNSADYLSPPDITTSQSWPLPGYDTQRISDVIEE